MSGGVKYRVFPAPWGTPLAKKAMQIRIDVFVTEQHVPIEEEYEPDTDPGAHHVVAIDEHGEVVGTGRIYLYDAENGVGKIGRMAVAREHRGLGVGRLILQALMRAGEKAGYRRLLLSAQEHAIPFYEKSGFRVCSDGHIEADIPHKFMERETGA